MSIRSKVIACFITLLLLFVGVSSYNHWRFRQANSRLVVVNEVFLPISRITIQLQSHVHGLAEDMRRYYFESGSSTPDLSAFSRMVRDLTPYLAHRKFTELEQRLSKRDNQELKVVFRDLSFLTARIRETYDELTSGRDRQKFEAHYRLLRNDLKEMATLVDNECQRLTLAAQNEGRESLISSIAFTTLAVLFGIFAILLTQHALRPLPELIESIRKIGSGDFNQSLKVAPSSQDETALLAREYNTMVAKLCERDTKIREQQAEILQSERLAAVGQLSAEVVHEIRNPLNSISLNIDWLEQELSGVDLEVKRTLGSISREIVRLHQITESYLVRARVPNQERERTPVNELLQEILDFSREEDRAKNIKVEAEFCGEEIFVHTDRSRLKQAFLNVLRNAREAMPRGGRLTVRTELKDNVSRVHFSDSGYGMNESARQQAFRPFFTTKTNGSGLGLVLTKTIVEEAQGSLQCESRVGLGTTFIFQFPV